ncbi:hypothetical protein BUE80_DR001734 [Diplocarpon rosae]|nr:hypothetical protein BUE80_DR001734 [Diplocarpon rosae]
MPFNVPNERVQPSPDLPREDEIAFLTGRERYPDYHVGTPERRVSSWGTFVFKFSACPSPKFSFDRPASAPIPCNRPHKRRRALSDVDGEGNEGRKKRRLRLHLITSRLSRPFSQPASNIVNRGMNKIPIWGTKNRAVGRSFVRKAAIMNRVRKRMDAAREFLAEEQDNSREALPLREILTQKPPCLDVPLPPSPLGLSAYDAFDLEDERDSEYWNDDVDRDSGIYTSWIP